MKNKIIALLTKWGFIKPKIKTKKDEISIDEAISIVKKVPENMWRTGGVSGWNGESCFLGHLAKARGIDAKTTVGALTAPGVEDIDLKICQFVRKKHNYSITCSYEINDTQNVNGYTESHPKERMLHVLNDMKKAGIK